jgi:hypothetical protein
MKLDKQMRGLALSDSIEVLSIISSINDLLMLTEYSRDNCETNKYLSLISVCTDRLQQVMEAALHQPAALKQ